MTRRCSCFNQFQCWPHRYRCAWGLFQKSSDCCCGIGRTNSYFEIDETLILFLSFTWFITFLTRHDNKIILFEIEWVLFRTDPLSAMIRGNVHVIYFVTPFLQWSIRDDVLDGTTSDIWTSNIHRSILRLSSTFHSYRWVFRCRRCLF